MSKIQLPALKPKRQAWNKGRLIGQKRPLLAKQVWAIRARLELAGNPRDLALFNLAIDSKPVAIQHGHRASRLQRLYFLLAPQKSAPAPVEHLP